MAKTSKRRGFKPRMPKDWVYNELSYMSSTSTLNSGASNGIAFLLASSQSAKRVQLFGSQSVLGVPSQIQSWASIPQGGTDRVYAVQGWAVITPNTWNIGDSFILSMRLLHGEQDDVGGGWLAPIGYSSWANSVGVITPAQFANGGYLKEKVFVQGNISGTAVTSSGLWSVPFLWTSKRGVRMGPNRGLFMYMETAVGSIALRMRCRFRTLMSAA